MLSAASVAVPTSEPKFSRMKALRFRLICLGLIHFSKSEEWLLEMGILHDLNRIELILCYWTTHIILYTVKILKVKLIHKGNYLLLPAGRYYYY